MNGRRILAVTRKSLSQFRHDKRTLGFVIGMPLLLVLTFGYTFGGEVHDVRTMVVNQDAGPLADMILGGIGGDTLDLVETSDPEAARAEVRSGEAWAALLFPVNFTQGFMAGNATITVVLDGTSPPIVAAVLGTLRGAIEESFVGVVGSSPLALEREYVYGSEDTRFIDSFAPGVVALAILLASTVFSIIIVVREKTGGMLERLFSTPLRPVELVTGHVLALGVIAFLQSVVVLVTALLVFQVRVEGSIPLSFGVLLLFAVGNMGLGMMLSAAAKNELQAVQFVPIILFPSILITGVFYPLEAIPASFRDLSLAVPLTYANDALRSIMLRGWGVGDVLVDLLVLLVYAFLTLLGATFLVRRQA